MTPRSRHGANRTVTIVSIRRHALAAPAVFVVLPLVLLLAACGANGPEASDEPPAAGSDGVGSPGVSASAPGEMTSVFELDRGDCFSVERDQIEEVPVVDCEEPHEYEVFAVFDHTAGGAEPYPGNRELVDYADGECREPFEEFVKIDYESSVWFITSLTPSAETWAVGDREIVCTLTQEDDDGEPIEVTGSAEASAE